MEHRVEPVVEVAVAEEGAADSTPWLRDLAERVVPGGTAVEEALVEVVAAGVVDPSAFSSSVALP
jgi:hypothetical protein